MSGKAGMIGSPSAAAPAVPSERWLSGAPEAHAALEAAEAAADAVRTRDAGFPRQAVPILLRAEGFLVAARSSALAGRWRATVTFSRIAEQELQAILRRYGNSVALVRQVPFQPPRGISVIPLPAGGPL
jgi:hypothetical protein